MKLDFLTPGDWRDSYGSRIANDNAGIESEGGYEVYNMMHILACVRNYTNSDYGKHMLDLFPYFCIYIDGELFGEVNRRNEFKVFAPCEYLPSYDGKTRLRYPFGDKDKVFAI